MIVLFRMWCRPIISGATSYVTRRARTSLARLAAVVVDERARCRDHADVQLRRTAELQRSAAELLAAGATLE